MHYVPIDIRLVKIALSSKKACKARIKVLTKMECKNSVPLVIVH